MKKIERLEILGLQLESRKAQISDQNPALSVQGFIQAFITKASGRFPGQFSVSESKTKCWRFIWRRHFIEFSGWLQN